MGATVVAVFGGYAMKIMVIDDCSSVIRGLREIFKEREEVFISECHSVSDALVAIAERKPDILFLDHSLTEGGREGLEIVAQLRATAKEITIYSTTMDEGVVLQYEGIGIKRVCKEGLVGCIEAILDGEQVPV